jgi:hypothetical protein
MNLNLKKKDTQIKIQILRSVAFTGNVFDKEKKAHASQAV